jgi:hypothetical protein
VSRNAARLATAISPLRDAQGDTSRQLKLAFALDGRGLPERAPWRDTPRASRIDSRAAFWHIVYQETWRLVMQCPVCSRPAENLTPNTLDGVVVGCHDCGSYRIHGGAFYEFVGLELNKRLAALEAAKGASQGGWPLVNASCLRPR